MTDQPDQRTARQRRKDQALHQAQMFGGEHEDYLEDPDKEEWSGDRYQRAEGRGGKIVAEDKEGQPYHRVQRSEDKQFPQSYWTGLAWVYGAPPGPRIPYRLPELLGAPPATPIFICEGEKDA